jgi:transposase
VYYRRAAFGLRIFLWEKGLNAKDIHKEMFPVYDGKCLSCKSVHNWVEKFSQGHSRVAVNVRPGRPDEIATEATVQRVEELIQADRRITIDSVATSLECSHGIAYRIINA